MTPAELLDDVKARFPLLLVQDEKQLEHLLRLALRTYQEKAGFIADLALDAEQKQVERPKRALEPISGEDARGVYFPVYIDTEERLDAEGNPSFVEIWKPDLTQCHLGKKRIRYFFDFVGMDLDEDHFPSGVVGLIGDYLYALIDIINTSRTRQVNQSSELPYDHLRSDAELILAKRELEESMAEQQAYLPPYLA